MTRTVELARCRLQCHPRTPCPAVHEVTAELDLEGPAMLVVRYRIVGDMARLRIPGGDTRLDPERLWEHTCCELFVGHPDRPDYVEWNFSPTGQVTRFELSSYRRHRRWSSPVVAPTSVTADVRTLELEARAPLGSDVGDSALISLTAVIEDASDGLSCWAMHHPSDRPDFHHRDGFTLALALHPSPTVLDHRQESP